MSVPEPTTDLWLALRTYWDENIWPPADEAVIHRMGESWQQLGEALTRAVDQGRQANSELPTYWRDVAGGIYQRNAGYTLDDLQASIQAYRDLAQLCFQFAGEVANVRNAILAELAANAFFWGLTLAMPAGWAAWYQLRILAGMVSRLGPVVRAAASALRPITTAVPQSLLRGAGAVGKGLGELGKEAAEELAVDALGQKLTQWQGYHRPFDMKQMWTSAGAGALGVPLARGISPLGRLGSAPANRLADALRLSDRGRPRAFLNEAGHGFVVNGITSPVSGTMAQAIADGKIHELSWSQFGTAIVNQGPLAGTLAASRFASTHTGSAMGNWTADRIHDWGGRPLPTPTPSGSTDPGNPTPPTPVGPGTADAGGSGSQQQASGTGAGGTGSAGGTGGAGAGGTGQAGASGGHSSGGHQADSGHQTSAGQKFANSNTSQGESTHHQATQDQVEQDQLAQDQTAQDQTGRQQPGQDQASTQNQSDHQTSTEAHSDAGTTTDQSTDSSRTTSHTTDATNQETGETSTTEAINQQDDATSTTEATNQAPLAPTSANHAATTTNASHQPTQSQSTTTTQAPTATKVAAPTTQPTTTRTETTDEDTTQSTENTEHAPDTGQPESNQQSEAAGQQPDTQQQSEVQQTEAEQTEGNQPTHDGSIPTAAAATQVAVAAAATAPTEPTTAKPPRAPLPTQTRTSTLTQKATADTGVTANADSVETTDTTTDGAPGSNGEVGTPPAADPRSTDLPPVDPPVDPPSSAVPEGPDGAGEFGWFDPESPVVGQERYDQAAWSSWRSFGPNQARWRYDGNGTPRMVEARLERAFDGSGRDGDDARARREARDRGLPGDQGGHALAWRFFKQVMPGNYFPQVGNLNVGAYKKVENEIAAWLDAGYRVDVSVIFPPGPIRPESVTITYAVTHSSTGDTVWVGGRSFSNVRGEKFARYSTDKINHFAPRPQNLFGKDDGTADGAAAGRPDPVPPLTTPLSDAAQPEPDPITSPDPSLVGGPLRTLDGDQLTRSFGGNQVIRPYGALQVGQQVAARLTNVLADPAPEIHQRLLDLAVRASRPVYDGRVLGSRFFGNSGLGALLPELPPSEYTAYAALEEALAARVTVGSWVELTITRVPRPGPGDPLYRYTAEVGPATENPTTYASHTLAELVQALETTAAPTEAAPTNPQSEPSRTTVEGPDGDSSAAASTAPVEQSDATAALGEQGPAATYRVERFLPGWVMVSSESRRLLETEGALAVDVQEIRAEGNGVYTVRTTNDEKFRLIKRVGVLEPGVQLQYSVQLDGVPTVDLLLSDRLTQDEVAPLLARTLAESTAIIRGDVDGPQVFRPASTPDVDAIQRPADAADRAELRQRGRVEENLPSTDHGRRAAVREEIRELALSMGVVDGQPNADLLRTLLTQDERAVLDRVSDRWQDVGDDRVSRAAYLAKAVLGSGTSAVVIGAAAAVFTGDPLVGVGIAIPTIVNSVVGSLAERYLDAKKQPGKKPAYAVDREQRSFDHPGLQGLLDGAERIRPPWVKLPRATEWRNYLLRYTTPTLSTAAVAGALSLVGVPAWSTAIVIASSALAKSLAERIVDVKKLEFRLRRVEATERIRLSDPELYTNQLVTELAELRTRLDRALAALDVNPDEQPTIGTEQTAVTPVHPKIPGAPPFKVTLAVQLIDNVSAAARRVFVGGQQTIDLDPTELARQVSPQLESLLNAIGPGLFGAVTGALGDKYFINRDEASNDARKQWARTGQQAAQSEALAELIEPQLREFRRLTEQLEARTGAEPDLAARAADRGLPARTQPPEGSRPAGQAHWSAYAVQVAAAALGGAVSAVALDLIFDLPDLGVVLTVAGGAAGLIGTPVARYLFRRTELENQAALERNKASHAVDHDTLQEERAVTRYLVEQLSSRVAAITSRAVVGTVVAAPTETDPHYTDHVRAAVRRAELDVVPPGRPESAYDLDARVDRVEALDRIDRFAAEVDQLDARGVGGQVLDAARAKLRFAIELYEAIADSNGVRRVFPDLAKVDPLLGRRVVGDRTDQVRYGVEQAIRRLVAEPSGKPLLAERLFALEELQRAADAVDHHAMHGTEDSRAVVQEQFDAALGEASRLWREAGVPNGLVLPAVSVLPGLDRAGGQVVIPLESVPPVMPAAPETGGRHHRPESAGGGLLAWNYNGARSLFPADAVVDQEELRKVEQSLASLVEHGIQAELTIDRVARPTTEADPYRFTLRLTDPTLPTAVATEVHGPTTITGLATHLSPEPTGRHHAAESTGRHHAPEPETTERSTPVPDNPLDLTITRRTAERIANRATRLATSPTTHTTPDNTQPPAGNPAEGGGRGRTVHAPEVRGTRFVADGRSTDAADLSVREAVEAALAAQESDFGGLIDGRPDLVASGVLVVQTEQHGPQYFQVAPGSVPRGRVAATTVRAGTMDRPHVVRVARGLAGDQLTRALVHEISHALQERGAPRSRLRRLLRRPAAQSDNACVAAQFNEFRLLARQWAEAQTAETARMLEQDLRGLVAAIEARGHQPPKLPWEAPPVQEKAPVDALVADVIDQVQDLRRQAAELQNRIEAKERKAAEAAEAARKAEKTATKALQASDSGRHARAHQASKDAAKQTEVRQWHEQVAAAYRNALTELETVADGYQQLLADARTMSADQRAATATDLLAQLSNYEQRLADVAPPLIALSSLLPTDWLPHLSALTDRVNAVLAANNVDHRFTPGALQHRLNAEFGHLVTGDGATLQVGYARPIELRFRLSVSELVEILDPSIRTSETMLGMLPQPSRKLSITQNGKLGAGGAFALNTLTQLFGDASWVGAIGQFLTVKGEQSSSRGRSVTATGAQYGQEGAVEDNRGESLLYAGRASWQVQARPVGEPGNVLADVRVDHGRGKDVPRLRAWASHAYTVPASTETVDNGTPPSGRLPNHALTSLDGLQSLTDKVFARFGDQLARHGDEAALLREQIRSAINHDLPSRLSASTEGSILRPLQADGRPVGHLRIRTTVRYEQTELVGQLSTAHWQERVRVGFSNASAQQSFTAGTTFNASLGYGGEALTDLGDTSVDLGPTVSGGRSLSRSESLSGGGVGIHVGVQRYTGPTQGYRMVFGHEVDVVLDGESQGTVTGDTVGLTRLHTNDAYRHGLPVTEDAFVHDENGHRVVENGRPVLRGDPRTWVHVPGRRLELPSWLATGTSRVGGAGPGLAQRVTGGAEALAELAGPLAERGFLPPLDANGEPDLSRMTTDPLERQAQLLNLTELRTQLSVSRLEAGYDIAVQNGIDVTLTRPSTGRATETVSLRIAIRPGPPSSVGVTTDEAMVTLNIGSDTANRSAGWSKSLPWKASPAGLTQDGPGGATVKSGLAYGRRALGRVMGWFTGGTVNQVTLVESRAPVAAFEVPHRLEVIELGTENVTLHRGAPGTSARILVDTDLLPSTEVTPGQVTEGPVSDKVLDRATLVALDTREPARLVREKAGQDPTARHHLAAMLDPRHLLAHPEWARTTYRTDALVRGAGPISSRGSLAVEGRIGDVVLLGMTDAVAGDINLALSSHGLSAGRSTGGSASLNFGATADSNGGTANAEYGTTSSTSRTEQAIAGVERLTIEVGRHYLFAGTAGLTVTADGRPIAADSTVVFQVAERDALRFHVEGELTLPLPQVADAVERYLNGSLELDRRLAAGLVRQYRAALAAAEAANQPVPELSASHTPRALLEKLQPRHGRPTPRSKEAQLDLVLDQADGVAATRTVRIPEHYQDNLGSSLIEQATVTDQGEEVTLFDRVRAMLTDQLGATPESDPMLAEALSVDLAGKRWWGRLEDMLGPDGFTRAYPIGKPGQFGAQRVKLRIKAEFTPEAESLGVTNQTISIVQRYLYDERTHTSTTGRSLGAGADGAWQEGQTNSVGTDRTGSTAVAIGEQTTRLERMATFDGQHRVRRGLKFTVEVVPETPSTPARNRLGRALTRTESPLEPIPAQELTGDVVQLIPLRVLPELRPDGSVVPVEALTSAGRPIGSLNSRGLPDAYFVEGVVGNELPEAVLDRLAETDLLGRAGVRAHRAELAGMFSTATLNASFSRMGHDDGFGVLRLPLPGYSSRSVEVRVGATVAGAELVGGPFEAEIGEVNRSQHLVTHTVVSGRLVPLDGGTTGDHADSGMSGGVTAGDQLTDQTTDSRGVRRERSRFEKGRVVTVKVDVQYEVELIRQQLRRDGEVRAGETVRLPRDPRGAAYLTMYESDYQQLDQFLNPPTTPDTFESRLRGGTRTPDPNYVGRHRALTKISNPKPSPFDPNPLDLDPLRTTADRITRQANRLATTPTSTQPAAATTTTTTTPHPSTNQPIDAALAATEADFGGHLTGQPTRIGPDLILVHSTQHGQQIFRVASGTPRANRVASTKLHRGTLNDPHVVHLARGLTRDQLTRAWVHQLTHTLQDLSTPRSRLRRLFHRSQTSTDAFVTAQFNEFRLLTRHWEAATSEATEQALRNELATLAQTIAAAGHQPPALPWNANVLPIASADPQHQFTTEVADQLDLLHRAADELRTRVAAKHQSAQAADQARTTAEQAAEEAAGRADSGRHAREHAARKEAVVQTETAAWHRHLAAAYQAALDQAEKLAQGYENLLRTNQPADARAALAQDLADQLKAYEQSLAAVAPSLLALTSLLPTDRLPHLKALTDQVNAVLAANHVDQRFTPGALQQRLEAEFAQALTPGGTTVQAGTATPVELRFRLSVSDLVEVLDPSSRTIEATTGQLSQSARRVGLTQNGTAGTSGTFALQTLTQLFGDTSWVAQAGQVLSAKIEYGVCRALSRNTTGGQYGQSGQIENNHGATALFAAKASWHVTAQPLGDPRVQLADVRVSTGTESDATHLRGWISHTYTLPTATDTVDRGTSPSGRLPNLALTSMDGLQRLTDQVTTTFADQLARLGDHAALVHEQIRLAIHQDLPSRLADSTESAILQPLQAGGRPVGHLQIRTTPRYEQVELVGGPSETHWLERYRFGYSTATSQQSFTANTTFNTTLGYGGDALNGLGEGQVDLGPTATGGRSVSRTESLTGGGAAFHLGIQRYHGPTQGYRLVLDHEVTLVLDGEAQGTVSGETEALTRLRTTDAYRHGLPIPRSTLVIDADGTPLTENGEPVLRGDPRQRQELPGHRLELPRWLVTPSGRLNGIGPGEAQHVTGGAQVMAELAGPLTDRGYLPPLTANGDPDLTRMSADPLVRQAQVLNLTELRTQLSSSRLEGGYDIAVQNGIVVTLSRPGVDRPAETVSLRIRIRPDRPSSAGVSTDEVMETVNIGSQTALRTSGWAKALPWKASPLGLTQHGEAGASGTSGLAYGRQALGRTLGWITGGMVNQATLVETVAAVAVFEVPHQLEVTELDAAPETAIQLAVPGTARILLDSGLLPSTELTPTQVNSGPLGRRALDRATLLFLETGVLPAELSKVTGDEPAAHHHIAALLDPRHLVAHPEWMQTTYRTDLVIRGAGPASVRSSLAVSGQLNDAVLLGLTDGNSADMNLALNSHGLTSGRSTSVSVNANAGANLQGPAGKVSGDFGTSTAAGRAVQTSAGVERLVIEIGRQYVFAATAALSVTPGTADPVMVDATTVFQIPERDVVQLHLDGELTLPVVQLADVVDRYLHGSLPLDRRLAAAVIRDYRARLAATDQPVPVLSREHGARELLEKLQPQHGRPTPRTKEAQLDLVLADVAAIDTTRTVELPPQYRVTLGSSMIERAAVTDQDGNEATLFDTVQVLLAERLGIGPQTDAVLTEALFVDLAGKRWWGRLEDMLAPDGFSRTFPIAQPGRYGGQQVEVRIRAAFVGDAVSLGTSEDTVSRVQRYLFEDRSTTSSAGRSLGAGVDGGALEGRTGSMGTDRSNSGTVVVTEQAMRLERMQTAHGQDRVLRSLRFEIEVATGSTAAPSRGRREDKGDSRITETAELNGQLVQLVPSRTMPDAGPFAPSGPVGSPVRSLNGHGVPDIFFVEGAEGNHLADAVLRRLAERDLLGPAGVRAHRTELDNLLSPVTLNASFSRLTEDDGFALLRLPLPGYAARTVEVRVGASVLGAELVSTPGDNVELGEYNRSQQTVTHTVTSGRLLPIDGGATLTEAGSGLTGGVTVGDQLADQTTDVQGLRREASRYERGRTVTVKVDVQYDVRLVRQRLRRDGAIQDRASVELTEAPRGTVYLSMFESDYRQLDQSLHFEARLRGQAAPGSGPTVHAPEVESTGSPSPDEGEPPWTRGIAAWGSRVTDVGDDEDEERLRQAIEQLERSTKDVDDGKPGL
ncbi:hypothetical protein FB561_2440 [Kribbella amoyensis]|uniref:Outer membrane channel protein CpnT-like N-terminal domain-containing protein n=1 Tax=Kribbella amoyensis TaxID=996641 RepID=A0A561BR22_9ACTN|nr:hypothetical protein [Kribbella amoyensis]TWD81328.1 hypothetical protein FB561_2440 [Kribbella amoyensis]